MTQMNYYTENEQKIPITKFTEVVVIGAGSAGWSAAVGAARCGAKVLLVDRDLNLGGTSTNSMMHLFGGPYDHSHGLMREVIDELSKSGEAKPGPLTPFDGRAYSTLLFKIVQNAGVEVLLNTWFSRAIIENNEVKGVIVENKGGRQAIMADIVIDASGDGDVAASAGAEFVLGRTNDNKMRPISLLFRIGNVNVDSLLEWVESHPEEFKEDPNSHIINHEQGLYRLHGFFNITAKAREEGRLDKDCHYIRFEYLWPDRNSALINSTRVYNVNGLKAEDLTKAVLKGREQIETLFEFIKDSIPGCENTFIIDIASQLGVRETRHIIGDYILQEEDLITEREFSDALFKDFRRMVPGAAVHSPDGNEGAKGDDLERDQSRKLFPFNIPYRSFLPKGIDNLLVAGRCFSADHQADGWTRDIPGCILMGQATGVASAIAIRDNVKTRDVNLNKVRIELEKQNIIVPKYSHLESKIPIVHQG
ncbi:FAD-dependent oxidoreductase [Bacillaceae bacterium CLA-AA-H227]|uniref:FAD-dependent oxidoreductase n=1 Tax=Robertmurraya yapensis (ex Hitch et al 2024) TaxID=3133160 RepID=A0ACC6SG12_9BACI